MAAEWTDNELIATIRAYLWMQRSVHDGHRTVKKRVREALIAGPLSERSHGSVEYRFQNISAVLHSMGEEWLEGYLPQRNVGDATEEKIKQAIQDYRGGGRHPRRVSFLVRALPPEGIREATERLASGEDFDYPDSTTFDVVADDGTLLAPKRVIGLAGLIHYGAPLKPEDFSGGEDEPAFARIRKAGLAIGLKADPDSQRFRKAVSKRRKKGFKSPPKGNKNPAKTSSESTSFDRDTDVVAYAEERAKGICELCNNPAPFQRPDGTDFLEVHHIIFLAEGGPDTIDNVAALCPSCHQECHHGQNAAELKAKLLNLRA